MALFPERYGFPLTIYLFSVRLGARVPGVNLLGHDAGHLWRLATGQHGDPHAAPLHLLSFVFIFAGFALLSNAWHVPHHAQREHHLATAGPCRRVRHPQYIGFVSVMFGFLLRRPTLLTLVMFPVLLVMYVRLAISEECDSEKAFGADWRTYAAATPRFIPRSLKHDDARPAGIH